MKTKNLHFNTILHRVALILSYYHNIFLKKALFIAEIITSFNFFAYSNSLFFSCTNAVTLTKKDRLLHIISYRIYYINYSTSLSTLVSMHYISRKRPLKHLDFSTQDRWLCIEYHIKFISIYIVIILEIRLIDSMTNVCLKI